MVDLDPVTCPYCKDPVSGRNCDSCGRDTVDVETVRCDTCADEIALETAEEYRYQRPITARWVTEYYCFECSSS